MSDTTQSPTPTRGPNHSPMRRLRIGLLSSAIPDDLYTETISSKNVSSGVVNDDEVVVKRGAIRDVLALLEENDPSCELFVELTVSPLAPEQRGYKKVDEGASALEALKAKLQG